MVERLADLASRDAGVKDHDLLLQSELLKCLKAAANHKQVGASGGGGARFSLSLRRAIRSREKKTS